MKIITSFPIATESKDHTEPKGTKNDNTKSKNFVDKIISLFGADKVKYLDLGCAGGGFVKQFVDNNCLAAGVDGSDYSFLKKRAEWGNIPNNLFTADITKPFYFTNDDGTKILFNIISAYDVLEHLHEHELDGFYSNLKNNLDKEGIFVCSIANFQDTGYHHTLKPKEWWIEQFSKNGFKNEQILNNNEYGRTSSFNLTFKYM